MTIVFEQRPYGSIKNAPKLYSLLERKWVFIAVPAWLKGGYRVPSPKKHFLFAGQGLSLHGHMTYERRNEHGP